MKIFYHKIITFMKGNIVFVGAGWTWMSGLLLMLHKLGFQNLIAIDAYQSQLTDKIKKFGITSYIWHGKYTVQIDDHVIFSAACERSEEVQTALAFKRTNKQQKLILNYFQFLGEISKYFRTVWVMGTNGKSSTTALLLSTAKEVLPDFWLGILWALVPDLWNQSYVINYFTSLTDKFGVSPLTGGTDKSIKNIFDYIFTGKWLNYNNVKKYLFIVEACEYKRHFLNLDLDWAILTSLELDHTDYFKDLGDYQSAFNQVLSKLRYQCFALEDYGLNNDKIKIIKKEKFNFKHIFGDFQHANASLVKSIIFNFLSLQKWEEKNPNALIENFHWLRRRMEKIFTTKKGATIFSDYGHVASSIELGKKSLQEAFPGKKIHIIFQPHQISRIANNREEFPNAFEWYTSKTIFDIYAARESLDSVKTLGLWTIKTKQELGKTFANHIKGKYTENFEDIKNSINSLEEDDILIIYSAGDIDYKLRKEYLSLKE